MNKLPILCVLAAVAAFPQAQTPLTITQSAGSATGELRLQERRTNGTNYVGIKSPQSVAANTVWALPTADGTANQCLSTDGAGQWGWRTCIGASIDLKTSDYDWYQTPGVSLTAATPATVTLTPCPAGVAPYIAHYSTRIAGGTGAAETVLITAVSGSGATCDITFTPANNHTGSWTIGSASDGIQEAINYAIANTGHRVVMPKGTVNLDAKAPGENSVIYVQGGISFAGINAGLSTISVPDEQWAIYVDTVYPVHIERLGIVGTGSATTGGGIKVTATTGAYPHNCYSVIRDNQIGAVPIGIDLEKGCGTWVQSNFITQYGAYGMLVRNLYNTDGGDYAFTGNTFQNIGTPALTTTAMRWESAGGAKIIGNKFNTPGAAIDMAMTDPTIISIIEGNSFDNQTTFSVKSRTPMGFAAINIVGNTVTGAGDAAYIAFDIGDNTTDSQGLVVITGNTMQGNGTAVKIGDVANVQIGENVIGLFPLGIDIKSAATGVALGKNTFYGVTTPYAIASEASIRPVSPLYASGYGRAASSANNFYAIAEFSPPAGGELYNAILLNTNATGANSQRGIGWDYGSNFFISRYHSDRTTAQNHDFQIDGTGASQFNVSAAVTNGTITSKWFNSGGQAKFGTQTAHSLMLQYNGTDTAEVLSSQFAVYGYLSVAGAGVAGRIQPSGSGLLAFGTYSNHPVDFYTDSANRLRLSAAGMLYPLADVTYDLGVLDSYHFRGIYGQSGVFMTSGGTGSSDFLRTRKLQLFDNTGSTTGASYWDLNVVMSGVGAGQNSYFYVRDNGGNTVWRADKIASGSPVATTTIYTDLLPDSTANVRDLGKTTQRWDEINGASLDLTGAANITGNISAAVINATGSPAYRVSGTTVINASREATFTDLTINTASAPTVGYVWTATSTGGAGSWQAAAAPSAPLTLTQGASGYSNPLTVSNSTIGVYGSCVAMAGTDTVGSTVYIAGRMCGRYDSASFTDELVTIQTASGVGAYDVAMTLKNQAVTMPGTLDVTGNISAAVINATGSPAYRVSGTTVINASREATFTDLTINTASAPTVGYVWTATSTGGAGSWQASGSSKWTAGSGTDVYRSAGNVGIGTSAPQGLIDLFSASNIGTAPLISMRSDFAAAGRFGGIRFGDQSQTSLYQKGAIYYESVSTAARGKIHIALEATDTSTSVGLSDARLTVTQSGIEVPGAANITGNLSAAVINATGSPAYRVSGTTVIDASRNASFVGLTLNGSITGDLIPATSAVYVIGSSSFLWNNIHADIVTVYTSLIPDASASANLGGSTKRWTKTWTADLDITGTVTPPSGTAFTGTKTVRASGGASDCTLTFSAGIMTGGTC